MMKPVVAVRSWRRIRTFLLLAAAGMGLSLTALSMPAAGDAGCPANSESRRLDFWLGDWKVTYPGAPAASTSKVFLDLDQCLVVESWTGGKGHRGKNFFAYSSDDKSWHGMFADNEGRVHGLQGKVAPGSAEFYGPSLAPDGRAVLNRIKVIRVAPDKVEQTWEKSTDQGTTWTMVFSGEYTRKSP